MKKKLLGIVILLITISSTIIYIQNKNNIEITDPIVLANIEALATGETIKGGVCFYKGNEFYEKRIPCKADYPNIGPCGEPEYGYYSDNRAQCAK